MRNKNATQSGVFQIQNNIYQTEEDNGKFIYDVNKINERCITLQCRNRACLRKMSILQFN